MQPNNKMKRYICTYLKKQENGEFKFFSSVICETSERRASTALSKKYDIPNKPIVCDIYGNYKEEGIKTVRLLETNTYVGGSIHDNFRSDS